MNKTFCILTILALASGCGKTINDTETSKARFYSRSQELPDDLTLEVDEDVSSSTIFEIPKNALFKLPTELIAKDGNAIGKKIEIFYDFSSSRAFKLKCTYYSTDHDTTLAFEKCEASNGDEI